MDYIPNVDVVLLIGVHPQVEEDVVAERQIPPFQLQPHPAVIVVYPSSEANGLLLPR